MNKDEYVEFEKMAEYEQKWSFLDKISSKLYLESLVKFNKLQFSLHIRYWHRASACSENINPANQLTIINDHF